MKIIKLVSARFENFKKLNRSFDFGNNRTEISAYNKAGKSSIADGIFWVLFGKSSTGKSEGKEFRPRPYDAQGIDVDHIDVVAELVLDVDGTQLNLRKTQRQKWVRKRGTTSEVHEGDMNVYEWNNVNISETEWKNRISDIVSESNFQLITSPTYFFGLTKKDKLDLILSLVANVTEEQILVETGGSDELLEFIKSGKTLVEIGSTAKRSITDMTKERDQISAFINERSKDIIEVDESAMELERNAIKDKIEEIDSKINDTSSAVSEFDRMSDGIIELKMKKSDIECKANEALVAQKKEIQKRADAAESGFRDAMQNQKEMELEVERLKRVIDGNTKLKSELINRFTEESKKEFREYVELEPLSKDSLVCPTCGQELPEELKQKKIASYEQDKESCRKRYDSEKEIFETLKKSSVSKINAEGKACAENIAKAQSDIKKAEDVLSEAKNMKIKFNADKTAALNELASLPEQVDLSENQEYEALCLEISKSEEALKSMNTGADYRSQLKAEKSEWEEKLAEVNSRFALIEKSEDAKDRIADLEQQFKDKVQLIANQERILMMCEEFQTQKDNYLTDKVNARFENVRFQLFRQQKNGGVERVCDVYTKNGSPYGDNTTSGAEKLIMGLEIVNVMSDIIGVKAPVIVDNAERVSEGNMPDIDTQMIILSVSTDKDFRIEVE